MVKKELSDIVYQVFNKDISNCSNEEIYVCLLKLVKEKVNSKKEYKTGKKLYYISAEFLIGKLLSNNLINLGIYDDVKQLLLENNKDLNEIEEVELEPSLGNGGLGRLAACFLDSIATLGLNGDGIGLNYHFGLFKQVFQNRKQETVKNEWITENNCLKEANISFDVEFRGFTLKSKLYDIDVTGYNTSSNKLRLFDLESIDESIVNSGIDFDKKNILNNLTLFLYPDDSDEDGHLLRIYQQYFMVSNAAQLILMEVENNNGDLSKLYDYVTIQINDTHPSMIIPELIRLLTLKNIDFENAVHIVSKTCAYTNHTILAEALEKWPLYYLNKVVPNLVPIIEKLDRLVKDKFTDERVHIIDKFNKVHMAHMDIHFCYSVNGVAKLHTDILKNEELKSFFDIYPEKFNNKTNGITFRRWLIHCNNELSNYISSLIGNGFKTDAKELEKLLKYKDNEEVLLKLYDIKTNNKKILKKYLKDTQNVDINENSIFDIQIKRLHEYKRQQMNLLYIIYKYLKIKSGEIPKVPITMIIGGKAAPAYTIAQDIIHAILCMQEIITKDNDVNKHLNLVMIENYNVTKASKLIPSCDISEQISLASKEASGTGNMKFMLNGAITLGTEDGANVEIQKLVGDENIYIFGKKSEEIINIYKNSSYVSKHYYEQNNIKPLVDFIVSKEMKSVGDEINLYRLYNEIVNKDWFMTLIDIEDYINVKDRCLNDYDDKINWMKKVIVNISKAGFFSSDRTIDEYNKEIWQLK